MNTVKEMWMIAHPVTGETFESDNFDLVVEHLSRVWKIQVPISMILLGRLSPTLSWTDKSTGLTYTISNKLV